MADHAHSHDNRARGRSKGRHSHGHSHGAGPGAAGQGSVSRGLFAGIAINLVIVVIEVMAGLVAGSLGLLSDALHNFTDMAALGIAWYALAQARKPATAERTFGHHRLGIMTALINALLMIGVTLWIFYEAYGRLLDPQPVGGALVLVAAALALAANLSIVWILRSRASRDINIRSAVLHLLADAAASAAVFISAVVIIVSGWYPIDPLVSIALGLAILWGAWQIIRETIEIFLEHSPRSIDVDRLVAELKEEDGVRDIHDVHVWTIGSELYALSCHVLVDDVKVSESSRILADLKKMLATDFGIVHSTLEVESCCCDVSSPYCNLNHEEPETI